MKAKILLAAVFVALVITGCKNVPDESLQPTTDMMEMESSMLDEVLDTETTTQPSTTQHTTTLQVETNSASQKRAERVTENSQEQSVSGNISAARAEEIALAHAGVSKSEARGLTSKLDTDDGRYEYKVDFYANGYEYDYEIDARSGKVIDSDKERD